MLKLNETLLVYLHCFQKMLTLLSKNALLETEVSWRLFSGVAGRIAKNGHKDGLSCNFNELRVVFLFLCLKWLF